MPKLPKRRVRERISEQERNRRRAGLGFSRHDDDDLVEAGLEIVERFLADVRQRPSDVSGLRTGEVFPLAGGGSWGAANEAVHVRTRGAFNPDFLNVCTLTDWEHRKMPGCQQNNPEFFEERGIDVDELLWRVTVDWLSGNLDDCRWLAANAQEGTLAKLCADVLEGVAGVAVTHRSETSDKESSAS